jgi:hypothetical protein
MRTVEIVPSASALVHSLRGLGYSPETAIADLLDNSISAGGGSIDVVLDWNDGTPRITILDDGVGMDVATLTAAMCFGGAGPKAVRSEDDLGRFGLGLKTASLSQCRRMTIISRRNERTSALCWDVDEIERRSGWQALVPEPIPDLPQVCRLLERPCGTLVIWERMDAVAGLSGLDRETFFLRVQDIRAYLAMIFHRYLGGDARRITLTINGRGVAPWDPFQRSNPATITMQAEPIRHAGQTVRVTPYVLPHRDRFANESQYEEAGGVGGWGERQGFYVYRQKRLLVPGGWLGLGGTRAWTREESSRLARIAVDLPLTLDSEWRIDVRKSQARPPGAMRSRLTTIAALCRHKAREVFAWRGHRARGQARSADDHPVWLNSPGNVTARYRINREHPSIAEVLRRAAADAPVIDAVFTLVERAVPVERIWLDVSEAEGAPAPEVGVEEVDALAIQLAAVARMLPASTPAEQRADQLIRHLPGNTARLRSALLRLLEPTT